MAAKCKACGQALPKKALSELPDPQRSGGIKRQAALRERHSIKRKIKEQNKKA